MARCLSAVATRINGRLNGDDADFGVVGTDTRTLPPGSLFVAIKGERFDGNAFVAAAAERGAVGAMVTERQDVALPQIEVHDTRVAFGAMARAWRENFDIPVVAVTGSAGKTTVKELIGSILRVGRRVCVTEGSLNNEIGVPLSLMRLEESDEALVVELGANHAGEIANLGSLVEPTVGVITNAGAAHLEGFGSIAGVARAKGELIDCLPDDGIAVLNSDDDYFDVWRRRAGKRRVLSFGLSAEADYGLDGAIEFSDSGSTFSIATPAGEKIAVRLALLGRANVANALAAAAAASAAGASADEIRVGLERAASVQGRMRQLAGQNGATLIDDSYNANPSAARVALDFLAGRKGLRIFVLGDMLELGDEAAELHREIGEYASTRCDRLVAVGGLAAEAAMAFGASASAHTDIEAAAAEVRDMLAPGVTVLVKASRSVGLDRLVAALRSDAGNTEC
ncbi:MAG: UDP-N-acetylmuramoyl-tripeptide--D-alanyl-D-alanine ligase [Gammaproteobacteria bacterium]|jgi:UDP-N-acetylmuramoyl-tripeptide--D-alanyl-D-alanine ligase